MKDDEFLAKAREDPAVLIAELDEKRKWQRFAAWLTGGILIVNMIAAWFSDWRWIDYGPLFEGVMMALFAATWLYYDALLKVVKLRRES